MQKNSILKSRTTSVVAGSAVLVALGGVSGAFAAATITSADIKNGEVKKADIGADAVGTSELQDDAVGFGKLKEAVAAKINESSAASNPHYQGANWGIIDRNTIGNGDAYLRSGPSAAGDVAPPEGIGSLGLRTGSSTDKAAFGNQVDFAGDKLADVDAVEYSVFTTGENARAGAGNLPNVAAEVDTSADEGIQYSTLVFTPETADANKWTKIDATTAKRWYFTGAAGTSSNCNQTTYCTLEEAKAAFKDASLLTVGLSKGRDNAFSGAVDALVWDDTTYDFEPTGVEETS